MAINGRRFLELEKATSFRITGHAIDRLKEYSGERYEEDEAQYLFFHSEQVSFQIMRELGYKPDFHQRKRKGVQSWYFRFFENHQEFIAVISEGEYLGEFKWVTTYRNNHWNQSNQCWVDLQSTSIN